MIEFQQVHKTYRVAGRDIPALHPTSLSIENGQVFGLIGHSGAGKSTLLRLINRLEAPSGGKIIVDGEDVTAFDANQLRGFRQQVGMIFQHFNLLASKTVADNVGLPLTLAGQLSRKEIDARVAELLQRRALDQLVRLEVEVGSGLVEHEDAALLEQRARHAEQLALAGGEVGAALGHLRRGLDTRLEPRAREDSDAHDRRTHTRGMKRSRAYIGEYRC